MARRIEEIIREDAIGTPANTSFQIATHQTQGKSKCKLAVCKCLARTDDLYCSDYCRQASTQGAERDFCQCEHPGCSQPADRVPAIGASELPVTISFAPGQVTIAYSDERDLRDQLILLAQRLAPNGEPDAPRRLPASRATSMKATAEEYA